jgi:hypothetical protein
LRNPHETQLTWKTRHAGPLWIRNASFSARLSEAPWSQSSCQSPCSAWASTKWVGGATACSRPYSKCAAGPARDDEAPAPSAGHPNAATTSPLATSAPAEASGADTGALTHWSQPGGGTSSSSGISTTAALGLPAAAGAGEVGGAATATAVVAAATDTAGCGSTAITGCCGSATAAACCASVATGSGSVVVAAGCGSVASATPRGSPLAAAAVLAAARDALDECRLVGTTVSVLITLAGARGGTVGATLRTRR